MSSFNGRLRDECLNETLFTSLAHARFVLDAWRHDYNHARPHSKLSGRTPAEKVGEPVWGHAPRQVVIHSTNHHEGAGLPLTGNNQGSTAAVLGSGKHISGDDGAISHEKLSRALSA